MDDTFIAQTPNAIRAPRLDLASLEREKIHHLLVELAEDGAGMPLHVPVLVARGRGDKAVFGIVAALHGNELNGIWVIHRLFRRLDPSKLEGDVVAVVVANVPGFVRRQRGFSDGQDLNRLFPGRAKGTPSQVWAYRLRKRVIVGFDYLLDLHTAGAGRVNSVYARIDSASKPALRMVRALQPHLVVHKPAKDKSLRGWAASRGITAVTLEIGDPQLLQRDLAGDTVRGIRRALRSLGITSGPKKPPQPMPPILTRSSWLYTDRGGLLEILPEVGVRVATGEVVARQRNVFGEMVREYTSPTDGWVLGKSSDPVAQTGTRIVHLGFE
jgi:predicted deacylase